MAPSSPIKIADVAAAEPVVMSKLDDEFFHVRFEKATPAERRYMAAMADIGNGPCRTGTSSSDSGVLRHFGLPRLADQERLDLQSRLRTRGLHGPSFRAVHGTSLSL